MHTYNTGSHTRSSFFFWDFFFDKHSHRHVGTFLKKIVKKVLLKKNFIIFFKKKFSRKWPRKRRKSRVEPRKVAWAGSAGGSLTHVDTHDTHTQTHTIPTPPHRAGKAGSLQNSVDTSGFSESALDSGEPRRLRTRRLPTLPLHLPSPTPDNLLSYTL